MVEFYTIENFLSEDEAKFILDFTLNNFDLEIAPVGNGIGRTVDTNYRKSSIKFIDYSKEFPFIIERLKQKINPLFKINRADFDFEKELQFTEYKKNEFYTWHRDSNAEDFMLSKRVLSVVILLNNTYTGGDLEILDINGIKNIFPKKIGNAFIFPSYLEHRVTTITEGNRYSLVGWFSIKKKNTNENTLI